MRKLLYLCVFSLVGCETVPLESGGDDLRQEVGMTEGGLSLTAPPYSPSPVDVTSTPWNDNSSELVPSDYLQGSPVKVVTDAGKRPKFVVGSQGGNCSLPLTRSEIDVQIAAHTAHVSYNQVFDNDCSTPLEAVYSFKLTHIHVVRSRTAQSGHMSCICTFI